MAESRFNALRHLFGNEGRANEISFEQFCALPERSVETLLGRVADFTVQGEIALLRTNIGAGNPISVTLLPVPIVL